MSGELDGKVAIVTGSTQGLGAGIARYFAKNGAKVVLSGRNQKNGDAVAASLGADVALFHRTDLTRAQDCEALVDAALRRFGGVDIIVNSAADTSRSDLKTFTVEHFDRLFAINVRAPLVIAQRALPSLRERSGTIINIGSVNSYVGLPHLLVYSATKGALVTLSKNLANALQHTRVRVFCLNIGWVDTEGERAILAVEGRPADFMQEGAKHLPMKRLMVPQDIAEMCLFLASPRSVAFSGAVMDLAQAPIGAPEYPKDDPTS
jgi:NAD(P)-dependent dehydrogenase (short-subunit alcohol dehydrogenase family)